MSVTDSLPNDAPTISGKASSVRHGHLVTFEDIPVLQGSEELKDLIHAPDYWDDKLFIFEYHMLPTVAIIAQTERSALAYLADSGFLDGLLVDRETARDDERQYWRLGNASLPFDLEGTYMRLATATTASLTSIDWSVDVYEKVFFSQSQNPPTGEIDYADLLKMIDQDGPSAAVDTLKRWHYPGEHETAEGRPWGSNDQTFQRGDYILNWNTGLGYVGLYYQI
jgi:hypothetical protein